MGKAIVGAALLLLTAALAVAACGEGDEYGKPARPLAAAESPQAAGAAGALQVTQVDFSFQPDKLAAQAGKSVAVEIANEGNASHTFTITELNVDQTLQPGDKATVTFTPSEDGTFAFFCRFHRRSGMEGALSVSGGSSGAGPGATSTPSGGAPGYGY